MEEFLLPIVWDSSFQCLDHHGRTGGWGQFPDTCSPGFGVAVRINSHFYPYYGWKNITKCDTRQVTSPCRLQLLYPKNVGIGLDGLQELSSS
jgi:hypothetical protein